jgi:membrane protease YdiL (CAAX protease family)
MCGEADPPIPQYTGRTILLIWAAAAFPMGVLGWIVAPALSVRSPNPVVIRLAAFTAGLAWQFALVVILVFREAGTLRWRSVRPRLWLNGPLSPSSGQPRRLLWLWLIPLVAATALFDIIVKPRIDRFWVALFPVLAEPAGWSLSGALAGADVRAQLAGAWGTWLLFLVNALLNTVIGEELLFRGLLLPRMRGVFSGRDWAANAALFGAYHLHQPWGALASAMHGVLFALPSRYFRSSWFGIVAHSGQSVFFAILLLGLVLGLSNP